MLKMRVEVGVKMKKRWGGNRVTRIGRIRGEQEGLRQRRGNGRLERWRETGRRMSQVAKCEEGDKERESKSEREKRERDEGE